MKIQFATAFPACVLSASMLAASGPVFADSDLPLQLILSETLSHDNNVFRQATAPIADTTTSTNAGLILDKQLSRQSLHAAVSGSANRYQRLNSLNNDASNVQANWQGSFPGRLSANATFSRSESLSSFSDLRITQKNIVTSTDSGFGIAYAVHPDLSLNAKIDHGSNRNSASINATGDVETDTGQLGVQYVSPLGNSVGLSASKSTGHYPNQQLVGTTLINNDYQQKDLQFNLKWAPGVRSNIGFHAGRTEREQQDLPQRNFSGATGGLIFDWAINNKTSLNAHAGREITAQTYVLANYAIVRGAGLGLTWTPTGKISASLAYDHQQRTFGGDPGFVISATGVPTDTTNATSLSLSYLPHDKIRLSMQMRHEGRDSSDPTLKYDANVVTASAQVSF